MAQNDKVIHVWVDPIYGDDVKADSGMPTESNPGKIGSVHNGCIPVPPLPPPGPIFKPNDQIDTQLNVLHHAPWPFKTITAAVAYIPPLPYTSPVTGVTWQYAIIHLLPGLYASNTAPDPHNEMPGNGETFPVLLPNRVSIQGTSFLNTIIELDTPQDPLIPEGPAFEFGTSPDQTGDHSFISSVTITGARRALENPQQHPRLASAIHLDQSHACTPTIVNTLFLGNGIGILIDHEYPTQPTTPIHQPTIVHCTFTWNNIGIWNGQRMAPPSPGGIGIGVPAILNCLFEATPPIATEPPMSLFCGNHDLPRPLQHILNRPGLAIYQSCFEGIDQRDLFLMALSNVDMNAFEGGGGAANNSGAFPLFNLPITVGRANPIYNVIDQTVNTAKYAGTSNVVRRHRGILYVRDLFWLDCAQNGSVEFGGSPPPSWYRYFDLAAGDFRLSPATVQDVQIQQGQLEPKTYGELNPMVDRAVRWDSQTPSHLMLNGRLITKPGLLPGTDWSFSPLDFDGEGYGNPRVVDHPIYPNTGDRTADFGCDELDLNLLTGQRFGTTSWRTETGLTTNRSHRRAWLLGPPEDMTTSQGPVPSASSERPFFRGFNLVPPTPTYYKPTALDITPHLLPDIHPAWGPFSAANPVWTECRANPGYPPFNSTLYLAPIAPVVNPPGTHPIWVPPTLQWLENLTGTLWYWGPYGSPPGPYFVSHFDAWCEATDDDPAASVLWNDLAFTPPDGYRFTLEFEAVASVPHAPSLAGLPFWAQGARESNLQSMYVFWTDIEQ